MELEKNKPLDQLNTFGLKASAKYYYQANTIKSLQKILQSEEAANNDVFILGGGSNILLKSNFEGLVIKIAILGKEIINENEDEVTVKTGAGENWHEFVKYAIDNNWGGIENLSLIPGTVGAAPMQNIGAYGVEIKEVFDHLTAINQKTGELKKFTRQECRFGYRESIFKNTLKGQYVITEVALRLKKDNYEPTTSYGAIQQTLGKMKVKNPGIRDVSNAVIKIRKSKLPDPDELGNAGSFFKNPTINKLDHLKLKAEYPEMPGYELPDKKVKVPAAWLIDQCGWKGHKRKNIGVHKNQPLVLVNYGGGNGQDIEKLAQDIQQSVAEKFGIELQPEVNIIGQE